MAKKFDDYLETNPDTGTSTIKSTARKTGSGTSTNTRTGTKNANASFTSPVDVYMEGLSDRDKTLNEAAQRAIAQEKVNYANATTDAQRQQAHRNAEDIRYSNGGYYAGKSGSDYITKSDVYVSDADRNYFNRDQTNDLVKNKMRVKAGLMSTEDANVLAEAMREQYGYSGGEYGDKYIRLKNADGSNQFSYQGMPQSIQEYQNMIQQLSGNLVNRAPFSYDPYSDPLYQVYAKQYTSGGQSAMQNTLAQIAARTGGLASSYAGTAAQQAYNGYMGQLAAKIPELYQLAYSMYQDEGNNMRDNLALLQSLSNSDYDRYSNERDFAYQNYLGNRDYNYQYNRDKIEDARTDYQFETEYNQRALETIIDAWLNGTDVFGGLAADGVDPNTYLAIAQQLFPNMAIDGRYWPGTL